MKKRVKKKQIEQEAKRKTKQKQMEVGYHAKKIENRLVEIDVELKKL